jgi:hypothetical protein
MACLFAVLYAMGSIEISSQTSPAAFEATFELWRNRVYLPVSINGSKPFPFILDTGASSTTLSSELVRELGVKRKAKRSERNIGTGDSSIDVESLEPLKISILDHEFSANGAIAIDMGSGSANGRRPYGVLGSEIFSRYVIEIDYANNKVRFFDPATYHYSGPGKILQIKIDGGTPVVPVKLQFDGPKSVDASLMVDTGNNGALILNTPFVDRNKLVDVSQRFLDRSVLGANGEAKVLIGRAAAIDVGGFVLPRPVAVFSRSKSGATADAEVDGNIGGDLLRHFTVIFDYHNKQMVIERNALFDEPFEYDMSGISLAAEPSDYKSFTVTRVFDNSPAANAGLRAKDRIVAIDGSPVGNFTLDQIQKMFKSDSKSYKLDVQRSNETLHLDLKLKRLI